MSLLLLLHELFLSSLENSMPKQSNKLDATGSIWIIFEVGRVLYCTSIIFNIILLTKKHWIDKPCVDDEVSCTCSFRRDSEF